MKWAIAIAVNKTKPPSDVTTLIKLLRQQGFEDTIYVFTDTGSRLPPLPKVIYSPVKNRINDYYNWRRAIRELTKVDADRYLLLTGNCLITDKFKQTVEQVTTEADVWLPFCSNSSYTTAFHWNDRPTAVWFSPISNYPSGWHAMAFASKAALQKTESVLPANTFTGLDPEEHMLGSKAVSMKYYFPSTAYDCSKAGCDMASEFTNTSKAALSRNRKAQVTADKLRVGFIVQVFLTGGTETWLLNMLRGLGRFGDITLSGVVVAGGYGAVSPVTIEAVAKHCTVYAEQPTKYTTKLPSVQAIATLAQESDILVVWAVTDHDDVKTLAITSKKIVGVNHGCMDWWMARLNDFVDAWATVSQVSKKALPRKGTVINNGLTFTKSPLTKAEAKQLLGLPPDTFVVGYIGRISAEKRIKKLAEAFSRLPPDKFSWLVVGPPNPVEYDFVKNAKDNFYVFGATKDVPRYLAACDAAIVTSEAEGFCYSAVEPILAGAPLISTPVGIVPELIAAIPDVIQPITVSKHTDLADEICKAIVLARENRNKMSAKMPAATDYAKKHFSVEHMTAQWRDFLWRVARSETSI